MENIVPKLIAGAAFENITPQKPLFLHGYPFVERQSTGVHDWLLSSALYLSDGLTELIFIANDIIFLNKASVSRIRKMITDETGIPGSNIMVGATHTHSGPVTVNCVNSGTDSVVPMVDEEYLQYLEKKIAKAGCRAYSNACTAELAHTVVDGTGIGTNRHDPAGPADMAVPALVIRDRETKDYIACMLICSMHPTVLHEDSKLYSGDFLSFTREILQKEYLGCECPVLNFTGPAGNQSPRHVTKSNTFEEAHRLGNIVASALGREINNGLEFYSDLPLLCAQQLVDLPKKTFPKVKDAKIHLEKAENRMEQLRREKPGTREFRTAEVDWFGAIELLHLAEMSESNQLDEIYKSCLPAEIQMFKISSWSFVSWPGEIFVEYALEIKNRAPGTFVISLANGELQGYIVTKQAAEEGGYEASNRLFSHESGEIVVNKTLQLIQELA